MRFSRESVAGMATLAVLGLVSLSFAQTPTPAPPPSTAIVVPNMHCMGCAKKMAAELYKVPGVAQVFAKVETNTMTVRPKDGAAPSPRGLWEAVEKAGYQPSRLEGPSGTFTSKPKS